MELITSIMTFDYTYAADVATNVIGAFAIIAAATPSKRDDSALGVIAKVFDLVGFNFGFAKNQSLEAEVKKTTAAGQKRRRARLDAKKGK